MPQPYARRHPGIAYSSHGHSLNTRRLHLSSVRWHRFPAGLDCNTWDTRRSRRNSWSRSSDTIRYLCSQQGLHIDRLATGMLGLSIRTWHPKSGPPNFLSNSAESNSTFRVHLLWTPGHASLPVNERAHAVACEVSLRAARQGEATISQWRDPLLTYNNILRHYRNVRRTQSAPPPSFSREEAIALRQLPATKTFPNLVSLHKFYLQCYADRCPSCENLPTTFHVSIECTANIFPPLPAFLHPLRNEEL